MWAGGRPTKTHWRGRRLNGGRSTNALAEIPVHREVKYDMPKPAAPVRKAPAIAGLPIEPQTAKLSDNVRLGSVGIPTSPRDVGFRR